MRLWGALAVGVAALVVPGRAGAVEREHQVGLELGIPMLVVQRASSATLAGAGLGVHYTYGLSDAINLVADAGWAAMPIGASSLTTLSNVNLGLAYVLDVLRWVPWGAAELGGYALTGDPVGGTQVLPGVALAVGLDYRFDRSWATGVVLRQHMLFTDAPGFSFSPGTFPSLTQALVRVGYTWGW
jgi:hypothetical protein